MPHNSSSEKPLHPKDKGSIAEASVIANLVKQGHGVALPIGENLPFDLIAIRRDLSLVRIQVKYRSQTKDGNLMIKLASTWKNSNVTRVVNYDLNAIDYFAIYCPEIDAVAYIPTSELGGLRHFCLRVRPSKNHQVKGVRLFDEYSVLK